MKSSIFTGSTIKILHVDDENDHLLFTKRILENLDKEIKVVSINSSPEALKAVKDDDFDCVVSDYLMPSMNGIDLARKIREFSFISFILYTGQGSEEVAERAYKVGVDDYIRKEVETSHFHVLLRRIRDIVEKKRVEELYKCVTEDTSHPITITFGTTRVYANQAFADLVGVNDTSTLLGIDALNRIHPDDIPTVNEALLGDQNYFRLRYRIVREDGNYLVVENSSSRVNIRDKQVTVNFIRDVTERHVYIERLTALHRHVSELSLMDNEEEVATATFSIIKSVLGYNLGSFSLIKGDELVHIFIEGADVDGVFMLPLNGPGITVRAVRTGETQIVPDVSKDPDYVAGPADDASVSELAVPIFWRGEPLGVINLESHKLDAFDVQDVILVETLALHVGSTLQRLRTHPVE